MVNFRYNIVAAAIAFVAALAAVATVQQKFEADLVAQLTSSAPEVVGCDLCKDLCSSQQVCIYNKKMNTTRCLRSGIFTSNSLNKYERSGWEVCEYEDTDDDECPDPPPCAVPPENCKYVRPVYDDNKCLISCGEIICEGDDDDDDDDKCAPIKCADGREFPSCKDGYPLNYFVDPCRSLCGNGKCEEGEADEINPGGCGPDAPPECLGPPAYYKKGTCPQDCPSDCADDGKPVFKKPALGPTHCCSKNAGVKPPSLLEDNGLCSPSEDGSVGICVQDWWRTCGDGTCDRSEEDRCSCPKDCIEQECVKAGGKTPVVPDAPECCKGLKKISVAFPDDNTSEQMVDENKCIAAVGAVICSDCGNGKCEPWENRCNCKEDCGPCSRPCPMVSPPYCPDGTYIGQGENECGCKKGVTCCGNDECEGKEDSKNCPDDCAGGGPVCGNGACEGELEQRTCPQDCRVDFCTSNSDCEEPLICSTSQGDCNLHPDCKLGGGCPDVCTGECVHPSADDDNDDNDDDSDDDSDDDDNDDDDSDDDDDDDNDDDDDDDSDDDYDSDDDNDDFECGDGVIDILEDCDDDNDESGDGCSQNCDVESGWSCTGEPSECEQEEAYDITLYGQLTDQLTGKPVSEAELLSAYEFEPSSVMSGKSGKFKFKVSTDFVITEGVEEWQSDSGGMWSFFNKCYGYANLLVRRDKEGYDMALGIHPFDEEEQFKDITSMRSVNAGKVQMYPQADISIQSDIPASIDVMFKYKNSEGYNGGGVGRLKTNHYLTAALPIDYDTFIQFTDEAGNTFNSSTYRIPIEAHCGTVNLKYVNGQSQWSFCGNRVTEGGEECDDGNKVDGDGCSSECKKEVIVQSETVADDADGYRTFKTSGIGWTSIAGSGYKEQHYAHSPSRFALSKGKVYARWSLFNVEPGTYDLYTTWPSQGSDNVYFGAVEYTRTFGGKRIILKNQKVSQSQLPGGPVWNGVPWQKVGEVDLETGKLVRVYIASLQSEKFAADAVRLVKRVGDPVCGNGTKENILGEGAARTTATAVQAFLEEQQSNDYLDIDGNGEAIASSDGNLLLRYLNGIRGQDLVNGAIGINASRTDPQAIEAHIEAHLTHYDADGNGTTDDEHDGTIILRFLFGFTGTSLVGEECDDGNTEDGDGCSSDCNYEDAADDDDDDDDEPTGNLYITKSVVALRSHQLLGGELGEPILRMQFRAQNEGVDVNFLHFGVDGEAISVDRLELFRDGESEPFVAATRAACGSGNEFCAVMENQQLVIQDGEKVDVLVRPRMKTDAQGASSGEEVRMALRPNKVQARGYNSSNELSENNGDNVAEGEIFVGTDSPGPNAPIYSKEGVSVMSKITSITNANEDPNGSAVPMGLSDIGKLKFTAASNTNSRNGLNAAEINGIIFNLNATNVLLNASPGNFRVYNPADSTITHNCKTFLNDSTREQVSGEVSGSLLIECKDLSPSAVDTNIYSGNSITLVLQGNVLDQNSSTVGAPSTLQVSLQNFESIERTDFGVENEQHMSHILWRDIDATSLTSFTWIEYPTTVVKSTSYAG
ncbi:MAG: hypothetical protein ABIA92_00450 [Patescibacteria group bacterium]